MEPKLGKSFGGMKATGLWEARLANESRHGRPEMKEQCSLTRGDFNRWPVWVRVQDYDRDEVWFGDVTEQTYRPWYGPLPVSARSQFPFVLVAAVFRLACGKLFDGYIMPVTEDWDKPSTPRRMKDGSFTEPVQWRKRHGGTELSVLALHCPVVFVGEKAFDFHLRRNLKMRRDCVREFYAAIGRRPEEVFPLEFSATPGLFEGICTGRMEGFYSFPLDKPYEVDRGDKYLIELVE